MIPFEFIIPGPPVSQQTRRRQRLLEWKTVVRQAAEVRWPEGDTPFDGMLEIRITYYYESDAPDVDNIIKPIQDALEGLVYVDDSQVVNARSRKRDIDGSFRIRGISGLVAEAFSRGEDFLHVKIVEPEDLEEID